MNGIQLVMSPKQVLSCACSHSHMSSLVDAATVTRPVLCMQPQSQVLSCACSHSHTSSLVHAATVTGPLLCMQPQSHVLSCACSHSHRSSLVHAATVTGPPLCMQVYPILVYPYCLLKVLTGICHCCVLRWFHSVRDCQWSWSHSQSHWSPPAGSAELHSGSSQQGPPHTHTCSGIGRPRRWGVWLDETGPISNLQRYELPPHCAMFYLSKCQISQAAIQHPYTECNTKCHTPYITVCAVSVAIYIYIHIYTYIVGITETGVILLVCNFCTVRLTLLPNIIKTLLSFLLVHSCQLAFFCPQLFLLVATIFNKLEELTVGHRILGSFKLRNTAQTCTHTHM